MKISYLRKKLWAVVITTTVAIAGVSAPAVVHAQEGELPFLLPSYRVGPFAPNGIAQSDATIDYVNMLNARDGGINGLRLRIDECETQYQNDRGIECYERYKNGLPAVLPLSAGIGYGLYDRAHDDQIPIITPGYGRLQGAEGKYFPYEFPIIANDWEQTTAIIRYIAEQVGGEENLMGMKLGLVYLDSAYGKEPFPVLDEMGERFGFEWEGYPVAFSAMIEQRSTWLQIRRYQPDYVLVWGWGVMTPTALKEAVQTGFPIERVIGNWWSAAEPDVIPAGDAAIGYVGTTFRMPGTEFGVFEELEEHVFSKGNGAGPESDRGTVLYNQGLQNAMIVVEAMRNAMNEFGNTPVTGDQTRWGLEHLNLTQERLAELGFDGLMAPINITCEDHAGGGQLRLIQWDGEQWNPVSDWISGENDFSKPLVSDSAQVLATEMGRVARDCAAE